MRPFGACVMKNMQYNPYLRPNCRNVRVLQEIGVEKHHCNVRFKSGAKTWLFRPCVMHPAVHCGYEADAAFHRTYFQFWYSSSLHLILCTSPLETAIRLTGEITHCNSVRPTYLHSYRNRHRPNTAGYSDLCCDTETGRHDRRTLHHHIGNIS